MGNKEGRKRICVSIDSGIYEFLKLMQEDTYIKDVEGEKKDKPYPLSYLVEDILSWVLTDEDRFDKFLEDNYVIVEDEGDEDDEEDEKENKNS